MENLPEFWRAEVWHPLSVHMPLSTLVLSTLFFILSLILKDKKKFWFGIGAVLLIIGTIGGWIAIYTGNIADGVVSRKLCDPTVLKTHETRAYTSTWIYTGAVALLGLYHGLHALKWKRIIQIVLVVVIIAGSGFLISVGHKGATLVYQQAAGVYVPSENCAEFTE